MWPIGPKLESAGVHFTPPHHFSTGNTLMAQYVSQNMAKYRPKVLQSAACISETWLFCLNSPKVRIKYILNYTFAIE